MFGCLCIKMIIFIHILGVPLSKTDFGHPLASILNTRKTVTKVTNCSGAVRECFIHISGKP